MDDNVDTEVLLALLSSLLDSPMADHTVLLDALVECNGNVECAADLLNAGPSTSSRIQPDPPPKKRKRTKGLERWIQRSPKKESSSSNDAGSSKRVRRRSLSVENTVNEDHPTAKKRDPELEGSSEVASSRSVSAPSRTSPMKVKLLSKDEFLSVLRPPNSSESKARPLKHTPLTLSTPQLVAKHTPCTIHTSILPPELACRLFYTMLDCSREWDRNRWYLFERLVESPHKTCFYVRKYTADAPEWTDEIEEATRFWYNGAAKDHAPTFPPAMEEACKYVERVVNEEMYKRTRFPLEWGGEPPRGSDEEFAPEGGKKIIWRANVAASNCYEGAKETVGFHTDALTYLGPYPTIASLSLGTTRLFRLREVIPSDEKETRSARTFNIPMPHNSLTIMHASCQEMFKHSVPPQRTIDLFHPPFKPSPDLQHVIPASENNGTLAGSNVRINITFRFFRPDFRPSTTPKCKCGVPCVLRPDMKNRYTYDDDSTAKENETSTTGGGKPTSSRKSAVSKYWWACNGGAQNEGKGCGMWKVMDVKAEGRGPFAGDGSES